MDFTTNTAIEVTSRALDALSQRHKLLSANVANADVPGYQRSDLTFENQLAKIMEKEEDKEKARANPGISLNQDSSLFFALNSGGGKINVNTVDLDKDYFQDFNPESGPTNDAAVKADGNNVNIEYEMTELAKNGTKYNAIATFQTRLFKGLGEVIKGGGV